MTEQPDLNGAYEQAPPQRGPSPASATVSTDPASAGPGTPLDLTGYAAHGPRGERGTVTGASGVADAAVLLVDGAPVPLSALARVDHHQRTVALQAWPSGTAKPR
jgi:hypothetical protein